MSLDTEALARELIAAHDQRQIVPVPPSARAGGLDLAAAYEVERAIVRLRGEAGRQTVGLKVGFANKAVWRALKLETLVWAHMYDDTVRDADANEATLPLDGMMAPKIEPEIVFSLRRPIEDAFDDPAAVLGAVEWLALGFEIIDCIFPDWKFQPADFVADRGLHAALIVGERRPIAAADVAQLADALPRFKVVLAKNGTVVQEGSGKNSLRSPALCLGELAAAVQRRGGRLGAGALISSGTLTESQPLGSGDTWTATVEGLDLPPLTLHAR